MPAPDPVIIPDRGEFIDALALLRRGQVLVHADDAGPCCLINGSLLYTAFQPLQRYGLIDEVPRPGSLERVHYFRLSARGRDFAERACSNWRRRPLWQRLAVRLTG